MQTSSSLELSVKRLRAGTDAILSSQNNLSKANKIQNCSQRCEKLFAEQQNYSKRIIICKTKLKKIENIQQKYDFKISPRPNLTFHKLTKLEKQAKKDFYEKKKKMTVEILETWWKRIIINRKLKIFNDTLEKSAKKIQENWKKFKNRKTFKENLKKSRLFVVRVQNIFRMFLSRKEVDFLKKLNNMNETFDFFETKKIEIQEHSAKIIQKCWKWFKAKQKVKQLILRNSLERKLTLIKVQEDSNHTINDSPTPSRKHSSFVTRLKTLKRPTLSPKKFH
jgi:hypothetical protein